MDWKGFALNMKKEGNSIARKLYIYENVKTRQETMRFI